jgi:XRE family aerobic/anaerobic benzoate catabolism transcriptional regulator
MPSETILLRNLGERIRDLRKAHGYSQEKLAELANIHENHVRRIEHGTANPTYLVLLRLARALKVPPVELLPR